MAEFSLHGVTKSFGKTEVIHKADITIDDGGQRIEPSEKKWRKSACTA